VNPVLDRGFPDPSALHVGDQFYAYATNSGGVNVQTARSRDLVHWQYVGEALPKLPAWARSGFTWAPTVAATASGYVLYFTARDAASGRQCVGTATSAAPEGPFAPTADSPLVCQVEQGGSIDASAFVDDDGTHYVLWKNDGNCCRLETWLYAQAVSPDGLTLVGEPTRLIRGEPGWEGNLVEAPTLWKRNGKYYLFYSANGFNGPSYAVGYAVADAVFGPYQKAGKPLLATGATAGAVFGPGGQDVVTKDGHTWLLYHAWNSVTATGSARYRSLRVDELLWDGDVPVVKPSAGVPRPAP
jgi:beta-xylosidase